MKEISKSEILIMTLIILVICCSPIMAINKKALMNKITIGEENSNILYQTDFEDEEYSKILKRGNNTELSISSEAYSGKKSLLISKRKEEWTGVQIDIDSFGKSNTEYLISAKVKSNADKIKLSYKYKDKDDNIKYITLEECNGDGWISIDNVKFTFYDDMDEVYLYFSATEEYDIYLDDFIIEKSVIDNNLPSLKDLYSKHFNIGVGVNNKEFQSPLIQELLLKHFNTIAIANELKPEYVLDKEKTLETNVNDNPQINIEKARPILEFCEKNNIALRGHTITWYDQTPTWFFKENYDENAAWVNEETMKKRLENYIKNLFEAISKDYPKLKIAGWDVVNEAWLDNGMPRSHCVNKVEEKVNGLMCSPWTTIFNDNSYIEYAFTYARKYASKDTKLYYADFHNYIPKKREAIYNMALELKEKNLIDGIALHSHLDYSFKTDEEYKEYLNQYDQAFELYKKTNLEIQVSELDISVPNKDYDLQSKFYSDYIDIILKHYKNISYLGFWGITDDNSWKKEGVPTLFFADYTAKPAFYAITSKDLNIKEEPKQTAELEAIIINDVVLDNFNSNILSYDITIKDKARVKIDAISKDQTAKIEGIKTYELDHGINKIKLTVTTTNGIKKEYTLNVTREDRRSIINTLKTLTISNVTIDYKPHVNKYDIEVENNIDKVTIESTLVSDKSTYIEDYSNKTVDLKVGINTFIIQVKAENENINKYIINITRKDQNPIYNTVISINNKKINFNSYKHDYEVTINEDELLEFDVQLPNENYTYEIEGNSNLKNGSIVKVIVKGNNKTLEYNFKIVKEEIIPDIEEEKTQEEIKDTEQNEEKEENNKKENKKDDNKNIVQIIIVSVVILISVTAILLIKIK